MFLDAEVLSEIVHSLWKFCVWERNEILIPSLWNSVDMVVIGVSSNSPGKIHVLFHDGDSLGMDGAQVGVFKNANQVSLS